MNYKVSRYNFLIEDNESKLRLYNSLSGRGSLAYVDNGKMSKIKSIFNSCNDDNWKNDKDFLKLVELGYIVSEDTNETSIALIKKNDVINDMGLTLTILPTEKCNFRCKYCYENHCKGEMTKDVQDRVVKFVRKNIHNYTRLNVGWFGGEPLESIRTIENLSAQFITICKTARKEYSAGITTNGYNLDIETFKKLIGLRIYDYQITIDGLKDTHDYYRCLRNGEGTFDKIISNIRAIKEYPRNIYKVDIRTNFTTDIVAHLNDYIKYMENIVGGDDRFSMFVHLAGDWGGEDVNSVSSQLIPNDSYAKLLNDISKCHSTLSFKAHLRDLDSMNSKCYAGLRNSYVIGADGLIYKCTEDFDLPDNKIGFIDENGNMIIDKTKLSKWIDCYPRQESNKCGFCKYWACCLDGSCPKAKILAQNKDGHSYCPRTRSSIKEIIKMLEISLFEKI